MLRSVQRSLTAGFSGEAEDLNMEQTYLMKEQAFIQQNTVKMLQKMDNRIEKLEDK